MNIYELFTVQLDPVHPGWFQVMHNGVPIDSQFGGCDRALARVAARTCHGCGWVAGSPFVKSPNSDVPLCLNCSVKAGQHGTA